MPLVYSLLKARAIRLWPQASHLFKTELLSISVGLRMYAKASPFSLALAMLVRDQVLSLLSELKFLQKNKKNGQNQGEAVCLVLPHASYGPAHFKTENEGNRKK